MLPSLTVFGFTGPWIWSRVVSKPEQRWVKWLSTTPNIKMLAPPLNLESISSFPRFPPSCLLPSVPSFLPSSLPFFFLPSLLPLYYNRCLWWIFVEIDFINTDFLDHSVLIAIKWPSMCSILGTKMNTDILHLDRAL